MFTARPWGSTSSAKYIAFNVISLCVAMPSVCEILQAYQNGLLLPGEFDDDLAQQAKSEQARQVKSELARRAKSAAVKKKLSASPPTDAELKHSRIFFDEGILVTDAMHAALIKHCATQCKNVWQSIVFVACNPSEPLNTLIKWTAGLSGAWVVSPQVLLGNGANAACIKYKAAIFTKRIVWASPCFRM